MKGRKGREGGKDECWEGEQERGWLTGIGFPVLKKSSGFLRLRNEQVWVRQKNLLTLGRYKM